MFRMVRVMKMATVLKRKLSFCIVIIVSMSEVTLYFASRWFHLLLVLGESVSLLGINNAESESSSGGGLDTVNISLEIII